MRERPRCSGRQGVVLSEDPYLDTEGNPSPRPEGDVRDAAAGDVDAEGDRARLRDLFVDHYEELCGFARRYVESDDSARDVVQEIFYRVWRLRHDRPLASIERAYLYRAVRNEALNRVERHRSRSESLESVRPRVQGAPPGPEEDFERRRVEERVREAVEALPPRCREVFLLVRHDGLTYREAARALDLSPSTIDTQMGRALKELRRRLDGLLDTL